MSIDSSAKNMQAVCRAKEQHDKTCPWGGTGTEVHMNWFDIERIGWEEGDVDLRPRRRRRRDVATGMMRVTCDAEGDGGGRAEEEEVEAVEAVAAERELQPVGPFATTDGPSAAVLGSRATEERKRMFRRCRRRGRDAAAAALPGVRGGRRPSST